MCEEIALGPGHSKGSGVGNNCDDLSGEGGVERSEAGEDWDQAESQEPVALAVTLDIVCINWEALEEQVVIQV